MENKIKEIQIEEGDIPKRTQARKRTQGRRRFVTEHYAQLLLSCGEMWDELPHLAGKINYQNNILNVIKEMFNIDFDKRTVADWFNKNNKGKISDIVRDEDITTIFATILYEYKKYYLTQVEWVEKAEKLIPSNEALINDSIDLLQNPQKNG